MSDENVHCSFDWLISIIAAVLCLGIAWGVAICAPHPKPPAATAAPDSQTHIDLQHWILTQPRSE